MASLKVININGKEILKSYLLNPDGKPKRCALVDKATWKLIGFFPINISVSKIRKII